MSQFGVWSKDFVVNALVNFIAFLVFYLFTIILVEYAVHDLQATVGEAGLAVGLFVIFEFVGRIIAGRLSTSMALKPLLIIGTVVYLLSSLLYLPIHSLGLLYGLRMVHGTAFGIIATATTTIVTRLVPAEHHGEGIGYFALGITLATAIGPFAGMWLQQYGSYVIIEWFCAALSLLGVVLALLLHVPAEAGASRMPQKHGIAAYVEYSILPLGLIGLLIGMCFSGIISFMSPYIKEIGLAQSGSWFFIVYAVAIILSRPFVGRFFDRRGENFVMYPLFISFALGMFCLGSAESAGMLFLSAALVGIGYGSFNPSAQALSVKLTTLDRAGVATATFSALFDIGMGLGAYVLGMFVPILGYRSLYISTVGIIVVCIALYYGVHGRKAVKNNMGG